MGSAELLLDGFERVHGAFHLAVDGLSPDELAYRIDGTANSIAWLAWHLTRIQDDHIAGVAGTEQVWLTDGWEKRFGLPLDPAETGYGHTSDGVAALRIESAELLTGYYAAVHEQTLRYVRGLTDADLPRIVDTRWDPPVTLAVRLVSVIADDLEHAGQAAFVRGIVRNR